MPKPKAKSANSPYAIVVPTFDRPENMRQILSLFPTALVTVNESRLDMFKSLVPAAQLLPHPDMPLIETRNWILDNVQADCIIQFNDDVRRLVSLGMRTRTFRDPRLILQVIENTLQCAEDLDIGVFCWSLTCNSSLLKPHLRPLRAAAPCSAHAFGVRGKARSRRFSTDYRGCGDFDFTLETLLHDRLLYCDVRWHFSCGGMSRGLGGQPGRLKPAEFAAAQARLRGRWHKYVGDSAAKQIAKRETWRSFSVNVQRTSPLAAS